MNSSTFSNLCNRSFDSQFNISDFNSKFTKRLDFRILTNTNSYVIKSNKGCVNALALSSSSSSYKYLVSGGDDFIIRIFNTYSTPNIYHKHSGLVQEFSEEHHTGNIFSLCFSHDDTFLVSAAADSTINVFDTSTLNLNPILNTNNEVRKNNPITSFSHDAAVYKCVFLNKKESDKLILSASQDGTVRVWDLRAPSNSRASTKIQLGHAVNCVDTHPIDGNIYATTGNTFSLRDLRYNNNNNNTPIITYDANSETLSCMFNSHMYGHEIVASQSGFCPIVCNTDSPETSLLEGEEYYHNSTTMKSIIYAGINNQFILCGSDDFRVFFWDSQSKKLIDNILVGRSIINTFVYHPKLSRLYCAGVEKVIRILQGFEFESELPTDLIELQPRDPFSMHHVFQLMHQYQYPDSHGIDEDLFTLAQFDLLINTESIIDSAEDIAEEFIEELILSDSDLSNEDDSVFEDDISGE